MSNFWKNFDDVTKAALATPMGQLATAHGFKTQHTGGGCMAWEKMLPDGRYLWICDEGNGLGDTMDEDYLVGLYTTDAEPINDGCVSGFTSAIEWCASVEHQR